ncbi:glutathione peroxidase [Pseudoxanthomonas sp. SGD-10]|nr:glutathione peroxidase [Pseudoxanthomonas sp. SGD-10]
MQQTVHQFRVKTVSDIEVSMDAYKGKVLLIVNTASECGFTSQFENLVNLKDFFKDEPFEILAFPSNDFGRQEPLDNDGIARFCDIKFKVNFPVFAKIKVRGKTTHPLYRFLSDKKLNGKINASPRWNFHKYLVNHKGEVIDFFYPFTKPDSSRMKKKIKKALAQVTSLESV